MLNRGLGSVASPLLKESPGAGCPLHAPVVMLLHFRPAKILEVLFRHLPSRMGEYHAKAVATWLSEDVEKAELLSTEMGAPLHHQPGKILAF